MTHDLIFALKFGMHVILKDCLCSSLSLLQSLYQ